MNATHCGNKFTISDRNNSVQQGALKFSRPFVEII